MKFLGIKSKDKENIKLKKNIRKKDTHTKQSKITLYFKITAVINNQNQDIIKISKNSKNPIKNSQPSFENKLKKINSSRVKAEKKTESTSSTSPLKPEQDIKILFQKMVTKNNLRTQIKKEEPIFTKVDFYEYEEESPIIDINCLNIKMKLY
jgi:hypothetical protein